MYPRIPVHDSAQVQADRRLLQFHSYDDYLDSLNTFQDNCYLESVEISRTIAELGYRSAGEIISKEQFEKRMAAVHLYLHPPYNPYQSASEGITGGDPLQLGLALRERGNRVGIFSTIIFLRYYTKGREISGYIDYADKLIHEDWKPFFKGEDRIVLRPTDLGYYHWRVGKVISNDSYNYKALQHPDKGLIFQNRFDRKVINPRPDSRPGHNTTRQRVYSKMYNWVILFDHVVRQRI